MVAPCGRGHDVLTAGAGRARGMLLVTLRTAGEIKDESSELFDEKKDERSGLFGLSSKSVGGSACEKSDENGLVTQFQE